MHPLHRIILHFLSSVYFCQRGQHNIQILQLRTNFTPLESLTNTYSCYISLFVSTSSLVPLGLLHIKLCKLYCYATQVNSFCVSFDYIVIQKRLCVVGIWNQLRDERGMMSAEERAIQAGVARLGIDSAQKLQTNPADQTTLENRREIEIETMK